MHITIQRRSQNSLYSKSKNKTVVVGMSSPSYILHTLACTVDNHLPLGCKLHADSQGCGGGWWLVLTNRNKHLSSYAYLVYSYKTSQEYIKILTYSWLGQGKCLCWIEIEDCKVIITFKILGISRQHIIIILTSRRRCLGV